MNSIKTIINEHFVYRKQIIKLAKSDLIKTYRGSALGWSWAFIKPMVTIFVFWFAFSFGLRASSDVDGYPFFLWMIAGFVPWFYMSEMITGGASCIRNNRHLVTKMKFPISVIPTFTSISKLVVHFILLGDHDRDLYNVWLYAGYILFTTTYIYYVYVRLFYVLGIVSGMLSAMSKDFLNLVKAFTTAIFWVSGIMYDVSDIKQQIIKDVLMFNPVTIIANGYRHVFIDKEWLFETPEEIRNYFIVLVIMIFLAIWAYKKLYKDIADVL